MPNQPTLVECSLQRTSSYSQTSTKAKHLDELVLKYIVKDIKPVSTVDSKHFRNLVNGLDPKYDMPRQTYFSSKLAKIYDINAKSLKDVMCKQVKVALTGDFWTSAMCQSYLTVT